MSGPWDRYQQDAGPWAKYAGAPAAAETPAFEREAQRTKMIHADMMTSPPMAVARGVKDLIDTGAGFLSRLGGKDEQARVRAENDAGRAEFDAAAEGKVMPQLARVGGNLLGVNPLLKKAGTAIATQLPRFGQAVATGGFSTGAAAPVGALAKAGDMAIRTAGGGAAGYAGAGMANPEDANEGGVIGALLPGALKVAAATGNAIGAGATGVLKHVLGLSTGVGAEPLSQAFKAGKMGNKDFLNNMRGDVPIHDVLDRAKQGISAMVAEKSAQYRSGMIPVAGDKTVLNLSAIDKALTDAAGVTAFKGQVKNESAAGAVAKMRAIVDEWKALDPKEFHTPEGLDALKQKLGGIMESIPFNERTARLAAGKVYTAAKSTIDQQAPTYSKVMRDYGAASEQISEIERALSLGDKASKDTAMRKLQSLMRNNVQTNYGNRLNLANTLEQAGGVDLLPSLAGQAMSSLTPRSLAGQLGGSATTLGAIFSGNPLPLMALPFQSPRIVGSMAYGAGRMSGGASSAAAQAQQRLLGGSPAGLLGSPSALAQFGFQSAPVALTSR